MSGILSAITSAMVTSVRHVDFSSSVYTSDFNALYKRGTEFETVSYTISKSIKA